MPVTRTIHTACAYSPKYKTHTYAAYIHESGHAGDPTRVYKVQCRYAIRDTKAEAEADVLAWVRGADGEALPRVDHGRKPFELVTSYNFP